MPRYMAYISRVSLLSSAMRTSGAGDHGFGIGRSVSLRIWGVETEKLFPNAPEGSRRRAWVRRPTADVSERAHDDSSRWLQTCRGLSMSGRGCRFVDTDVESPVLLTT